MRSTLKKKNIVMDTLNGVICEHRSWGSELSNSHGIFSTIISIAFIVEGT
jgi:hypothetical protein